MVNEDTEHTCRPPEPYTTESNDMEHNIVRINDKIICQIDTLILTSTASISFLSHPYAPLTNDHLISGKGKI
jgi:hypothetical protein